MTRLKMRELERQTGVGRETIRFYIREGLLPEPERPARNVAWYDESFVERLRLIKELQEKRYLPLAVIKSVVAGRDRPTVAEVEALLALGDRLAPEAGADRAAERVSDAAHRLGVAARELRELGAIGALTIETRDGDQWLTPTSVRMAELWGRARAIGFSEALGITPKAMGLYVEMVRLLARQELRLFTRAVAGRVTDADVSARMAEQGIDLVNEMLALLRRETLLRYVAEGNVPDEGETRPEDVSA